jgi:hypothetical protein
MSDNQKSPLQLNYAPPERFSDEERSIIRSTFKDNDKLLNILKKIMIPQYSDPDVPFELSGADAFNMGREWANMPEQEVKALVVARQDTINWIAGALTWLKMQSSEVEETPEQAALRRGKDSTK